MKLSSPSAFASVLTCRALLCGALLCLAVACSGEEQPAGNLDAVVNINCPIMDEPVTAKGGSVEYQGKTIGFCCAGCSEDFAKLDDAGKAAAVAKAGLKK
ncbi:MAG: hypothetical protein ACT4PU_08345 [Planctomycetota bacterium]